MEFMPIQTNGTLVDPEWAEFFRENDVLVGISIDGPQVLHDAYRVNKGGKGVEAPEVFGKFGPAMDAIYEDLGIEASGADATERRRKRNRLQ